MFRHLSPLSFLALLLPACLAVPGARAESLGRKHAVVVGINHYKHEKLPPLAYAEADATGLAQLLQQAGYDVTLLTGSTTEAGRRPTKSTIEQQLQRVLRGCDAGDTVLVAFAGHGLQFEKRRADDPGDAYFCPLDARPFRDETASLVSLSSVYRELDRSFAGMKILLVDACRDDPDATRGTRGVNADSAPRPPQGVAALFSCRAGERSFEHEKLGHGVFFFHVLQGLQGEARDGRGRVTFARLAAYVAEEVASGERGVPSLVGGGARQSPNLKADYSTEPVLLQVARQAWYRGKELLDEHDLEGAVAALTDALQQEPSNALARVYRAEALLYQHRLDEASADCEEALRRDGRLGRAFAVRAMVRAERQEYPAALEDAEKAVRLDPTAPIAHRGRALVYHSHGDYDRAIRDLNEALRLDPKCGSAYNRRGLAYAGKQDYPRAIRDYDEALRLCPEDASAYCNRGLAYQGKQEYEQAIRDHDEAARRDPRYKLTAAFAPAYYHRGLAFKKKADHDQAMRDYEEALRLDPKYADAYFSRGNVYQEKQDYDRAMRDYDQALRLNPRDALAYINRGVTYFKKQEYDRAILDLDKAIQLHAGEKVAYYHRGRAFARKQDYDRAIRDFNEALRLDSEYADAYHDRGNAYYNKQDYGRAIRDYDEVIRLDPKYVWAYNNRGNAYYNRQDYDRAIREYDEALRLDPRYADAQKGRSLALKAKGDTAQAETEPTRVASVSSGAPSAPATEYARGTSPERSRSLSLPSIGRQAGGHAAPAQGARPHAMPHGGRAR